MNHHQKKHYAHAALAPVTLVYIKKKSLPTFVYSFLHTKMFLGNLRHSLLFYISGNMVDDGQWHPLPNYVALDEILIYLDIKDLAFEGLSFNSSLHTVSPLCSCIWLTSYVSTICNQICLRTWCPLVFHM